jgi:hypothetical protein
MRSVDKLIKAFGGEGRGAKRRAAYRLGISPQLLNYWIKVGVIPHGQHHSILVSAKTLKIKIKPQDLVNSLD